MGAPQSGLRHVLLLRQFTTHHRVHSRIIIPCPTKARTRKCKRQPSPHLAPTRRPGSEDEAVIIAALARLSGRARQSGTTLGRSSRGP
ncbi:hypothetical protein MRX96_018279 [Rhipicephalus microplus]